MSATPLELVGGEEEVTRLADLFYDKVFADPLLLPLFQDPTDDHAGRLALWLTELFGGPREHSARRGGFGALVRSHTGLKITQAQRDRWLEHMLKSCAELGWSKEVMGLFEPYLSRSSHAAMVHSNFS